MPVLPPDLLRAYVTRIFAAAHVPADDAAAVAAHLVEANQYGHESRLGAYAEQALAAGMIGIAMVNNHGGSLVMSPPGGVQRRLSPNPIAVGIPTGDADAPFLLDMTTSVVAEGKIRVARNAGKPLGA